jgi:hypothetical protein
LAANKKSGEHLMSLMSKTKTALAAGLTALTLGVGALATSAPAEARPFGFYGGYRGFHGGFYRPAFYGGPRFYRPAFYGGYYRPYRPYCGGAVAAGLVGGLALGTLAASTAYGAPYYATPVGYGYGGGVCTVSRTRFIDPYGRLVVRKTRVCD